jgi:N-acetylglucosamine-6-sulfatase
MAASISAEARVWGSRLFRGAALYAAALTASCGSPTAPTSDSSRRPNFILVLSDDLDADPAVIDHLPVVSSSLRAAGLTFRNAFAPSPICCPTRASVLRGQYAHNTGITDNETCDALFASWGLETSTLPTWLRDAGYRTGLVGKYFNGYPSSGNPRIPPGWDEWYAIKADVRITYYYYTLNENGRFVDYGGAEQEYLTDVLAQKAVAFVRRAVTEKHAPFFLHLDPYAPHEPPTSAQRHRDAFPDAQAPRTPSFNEADMSDKPSWYRGLPPLSDEDIDAIDKTYRRRLQLMLAVDEMIGSVMAELRSLGELDNTYIVFASDNGFFLGQHRFQGGKLAPYEESIRIPFIVRGPGVAQGTSLPQMALTVDLAPTLAELAGAQRPSFVDGRSLVPMLRGEAPTAGSWRRDFPLQHILPAGSDGLPTWHGLRTEDVMYVEHDGGEREIYDLRRDPYQLDNLQSIADPEALRRFSERLATVGTCRGAACP